MADRPGSVQAELWAAGTELESLPPAPAQAHRAEALRASFEALARAGAAEDAPARERAEERIWAIWCDHPERALKERMVLGIRRLADGDLAQARAVFDALVVDAPHWAEAWNKRATALFLQDRDAASVADIRRALALEPRHFGALGGLAQIALRNGNPDAARAALAALLRANPGAPGVRELLATIEREAPRSVH